MKRSLFLALACVSALTATVATAQTTPVVVRCLDAGTPVAYQNGVGGTFVGPSAVKDAVTAVNADSTGQAFDIQIMDTDGTADTFTTTNYSINKANTTIRQVANPALNGNDAPAKVSGTTNPILMVNADGFTVEGISPTKKLIQENASAGTTWNISPNSRTQTYRNVRFTSNATGTKFLLNGISPNMLFEDCEIATANYGLQTFSSTNNFITIRRCLFTNPNEPVLLKGTCVIEDTEFRNGNRLRIDGDTTYTLTNCKFNYSGRNASIIETNNAAQKCVLTVTSCTFAMYPGRVPFLFNETNMEATFNGASAAQKMDLTGATTNTLMVARNGSVTFNDCIIANELGSTGAQTVSRNVTFNFNRSVVKGQVGRVTAAVVGRKVNAVNTIFNCTGTTTSLDLSNSNGRSSATLTHCTFFGTGGANSAFLRADASSPIQADYCVFDATKGVEKVAEGGAVSGARNVIAGSFGTGTSSLTGTMTGDLKLDAAGRPQAYSAAIAAAQGTATTEDIDGQSRAQGPQPTADAGADEVNLVPVELSGFSIE